MPVSDDAVSTLRTAWSFDRDNAAMKAAPASVAVGNVLAIGAILLWSTLAWLGVRLATMPPFLLIGIALSSAGLLALPTWRRWRVAPRVLALGIYGLFGYHFFLFVALRLAPPLEANLVNYLWPLLIVLLAPLLLSDARLSRRHVVGGSLGFVGAVVAIVAQGDASSPIAHVGADTAAYPRAAWGYLAALAAAVMWATYSLMGQRLRRTGTTFPTAAIGAFCLLSGLLALGCHAWLEPTYAIGRGDLMPLAALAIGPMGAAFYLWDAAMIRGDARAIGTLAYLTPVLSTALLALDDPRRLGWPIGIALLLVVGGAVVGTRGATSVRPARPTGRGRRLR